MREFWARIDEFPTYLVSTYGRVMNSDTGRILRVSTVWYALKHGSTTAGLHVEEVIS